MYNAIQQFTLKAIVVVDMHCWSLRKALLSRVIYPYIEKAQTYEKNIAASWTFSLKQMASNYMNHSEHQHHPNGYDDQEHHHNDYHQQGHLNGHHRNEHHPNEYETNGYHLDGRHSEEYHPNGAHNGHHRDGHHVNWHHSDGHHPERHYPDLHHPEGHRHHGPFNQTVYRRYHPSATTITGGNVCCLVILPCCLIPFVLITILAISLDNFDYHAAKIILPVAGPLGLLIIVLAVCAVRAFKRRQNVSYT